MNAQSQFRCNSCHYRTLQTNAATIMITLWLQRVQKIWRHGQMQVILWNVGNPDKIQRTKVDIRNGW